MARIGYTSIEVGGPFVVSSLVSELDLSTEASSFETSVTATRLRGLAVEFMRQERMQGNRSLLVGRVDDVRLRKCEKPLWFRGGPMMASELIAEAEENLRAGIGTHVTRNQTDLVAAGRAIIASLQRRGLPDSAEFSQDKTQVIVEWAGDVVEVPLQGYLGTDDETHPSKPVLEVAWQQFRQDEFGRRRINVVTQTRGEEGQQQAAALASIVPGVVTNTVTTHTVDDFLIRPVKSFDWE